ncbi:MAG: AtpZ/AtpI family protein [bacterium]|nr:AtpZ/AtpI family protein [Candidatus Kapabacteria bacterium]
MNPAGGTRKSTTQQLAPYMGLGLQLAAAMTAFGALGWWLDGQWATEPWLLVVGVMLGAIGGMISVIRTSLRANRTSDAGSANQD